jgi:hypothetical protein
VLGAAALTLVSAAVAPATADAASARHHDVIGIGGTGAQAPTPTCTYSCSSANRHLDGDIPVPVCHPASGGPFGGSHNEMPAPFAPSFDDTDGICDATSVASAPGFLQEHPRYQFAGDVMPTTGPRRR